MTQPPPRWARWIVGRTLPADDRTRLLVELDELYTVRLARRGRVAALAWYLRQSTSFLLTGARSRAADGVRGGMTHSHRWVRRASAAEVMQDLRYALRSLRRSPVFSVTALLTLGLGLAGAISVFTLVDRILLRPLPYTGADRLVAIFTTERGAANRGPSAPANMLDLQRDARTLTAMTAAHPWSATLAADEPRKVAGLKATWNLFDMLRAAPLVGRTWHAGDSVGGETHVVVLGYRLWQREFGGDPNILGQAITLNAEPYSVIGVMAEGFAFPPFWASDAELWVPLDFGPSPSRSAQFVRIFGRMRPGTTLEGVSAEVTSLFDRLADAYPRANQYSTMVVEPLREPVVSAARPVLLSLLGATILLLLVAVANVANLMLGRALTHERERALRSALGAPRRRLVAPDLLHAALLGLGGGVVGLGVAALALHVLAGETALAIPRPEEIGMDGALVFTALGAALTVGLAVGAVTAFRKSGGATLIRVGVGQTPSGAGPIRDALVVAEVAMAIMLLVGAGLTVRSLVRQAAIDPGVRAAGLLTATIDLAGTPAAEAEHQLPLFRQVIDRVEGIPRVTAAGMVSHLPLAGDVWSSTLSDGDLPFPSGGDRRAGVERVISPNYLAASGVPILAGRGFASWEEGGPPVVLVNQALADVLWPGTNAVGHRLRIGGPDDPVAEVIGVVGNVKQASLVGAVAPEFYVPYGQNPFSWSTETSLAVRTADNPAMLAPAVRAVIRKLAPGAPITALRTMDDIVEEQLYAARTVTAVVAVFAVFALLVSGLGLFGVIGFLVNQRRREFGIRLAVGATPAAVARVVLGRTILLVGVGAAVGIGGGAALTGLFGNLLYRIPTHDPAAFAGAILGVGAVGIAAAWWPARRAARTDPAGLLREE